MLGKVYDYDYLTEETNDVWNYIIDNFTGAELKEFDRDDLFEKLNDDLWIDDDVTGNGSGHYTDMERSRLNIAGDDNAEQYVKDLISDFCIDAETVAAHLFDWQYWDVSIRCYLLGQCIDKALDRVFSAIK